MLPRYYNNRLADGSCRSDRRSTIEVRKKRQIRRRPAACYDSICDPMCRRRGPREAVLSLVTNLVLPNTGPQGFAT